MSNNPAPHWAVIARALHSHAPSPSLEPLFPQAITYLAGRQPVCYAATTRVLDEVHAPTTTHQPPPTNHQPRLIDDPAFVSPATPLC